MKEEKPPKSRKQGEDGANFIYRPKYTADCQSWTVSLLRVFKPSSVVI